jgi:hypothetical protein
MICFSRLLSLTSSNYKAWQDSPWLFKVRWRIWLVHWMIFRAGYVIPGCILTMHIATITHTSLNYMLRARTNTQLFPDNKPAKTLHFAKSQVWRNAAATLAYNSIWHPRSCDWWGKRRPVYTLYRCPRVTLGATSAACCSTWTSGRLRATERSRIRS